MKLKPETRRFKAIEIPKLAQFAKSLDLLSGCGENRDSKYMSLLKVLFIK
jgi:hypothetical protein